MSGPSEPVIKDEGIRRWSDALAMCRYRHDPMDVPRAVTASGGVLVGGASDEQISAAAERLGVRLPPSYAAFLRTSNGAYGASSLQTCHKDRLAPTAGAARPTALLPVEQIDWAPRSIAWLVDLMVDFPEPLAHGGSTAFEGWGEPSEAAYLAVADPTEPRMGHLLYALHIGHHGNGEDVFLDPLTSDAAGEWQVLTVGTGASCGRSRSFATWMEETTAQQTADLARPPHQDFMPSLMDVLWSPDVDAVVARLDAVIGDPGREVWFRSWAFRLLGHLEERDGVDRRSAWLLRFLEDPGLADMPVVAPLIRYGTTRDDLPRPGTVLAMRRPGDAHALDALSRAEVSDLATEVRPDRLDDALRVRALPPHDSPVAVLLADLLWSGALDRPPTTAPATPPPAGVPEVLDACDQLAIDGARLIRALVRFGHHDDALARAEADLDPDHADLLYVMAEVDEPERWAALDRVAESPSFLLQWTSLVAAARTRSPLLVPRLRQILGDPQQAELHPPAWVALELRPIAAAAEALRDLWSTGDLAALRALARRRDQAITADAIDLLGGSEEPLRMVGAKALRDLRDTAAAPSLTAALTGPGPDDLLVTVAHALALLQVRDAGPAMRDIADRHADPQVVELLTRWAGQLESAP